ncbi:hypothetical protein BJX63DRAFT_423673 [Aspergillus granulosus]|uniref:Uncharacterized protein n=1 Tax=Aspergillus granulosus TaxID=176169 RepID=A0ABR4H2H2_9EURO
MQEVFPAHNHGTKKPRDNDLPSDEDKWNVWTVQHNVSGSTIHDATLTSASTMSFSGPILEGTFAWAKMYQSQAAAPKDESFKSNVVFSPIANRTRSKVGSLTKKLREAQLKTLTKDSHLMYPQTKDKQIVNTALVDFLNVLSMHFSQVSNWTLHRKSFKAKYLEDGAFSERVGALIEVTPMLREKKLNPIRMQEAAQMVAWIKSDPDPTGVLNLPGRRLHVSQDRHQIFITFAEYDGSYIQYLNNTLPPNSPRPFLKMHEFGPWDTKNRSDMENIGSILLVIALRAYSDAKSGKIIHQ